MLMQYLKYRYVKARMMAYLDGTLPVKTRRYIARQIDENPRCYQAYIAAKQTRQALERDLPNIGNPQAAQLDAIWGNIQSELAAPEHRSPTFVLHNQYSLSYGVAMLLLIIIMLAPLAVDAGRNTLVPAQQHPAPLDTAHTTSPAITPEADVQTIALAMDTTFVQTVATDPGIPLQNTPAPRTPWR